MYFSSFALLLVLGFSFIIGVLLFIIYLTEEFPFEKRYTQTYIIHGTVSEGLS